MLTTCPNSVYCYSDILHNVDYYCVIIHITRALSYRILDSDRYIRTLLNNNNYYLGKILWTGIDMRPGIFLHGSNYTAECNGLCRDIGVLRNIW